MTTNRMRYFRWTPRTAGITFMYAVVVPGIFGVIAYTTDVSEVEKMTIREATLTAAVVSGQMGHACKEERRSDGRVVILAIAKAEKVNKLYICDQNQQQITSLPSRSKHVKH